MSLRGRRQYHLVVEVWCDVLGGSLVCTASSTTPGAMLTDVLFGLMFSLVSQ